MLHPDKLVLRAAYTAAFDAVAAAVLARESEAVVRPLRVALSKARVALDAWVEPQAPGTPAPTPPAPKPVPAPTPAARPVKGRPAQRKAPAAPLPPRPAPSAERAAIVAMRPATAPSRPWRMSNRDPRPVTVETAATRAAAARASY